MTTFLLGFADAQGMASVAWYWYVCSVAIDWWYLAR